MNVVNRKHQRLYLLRRAAAIHIKERLPMTIDDAVEETGLSRTTLQKIGHEFRIEFTPCTGRGRKWKLKPEWRSVEVTEALRRFRA